VNHLRRHWLLEDGVVFLNHGSFGACPRPVLEAQSRLREQMEREPVRFFVRELEPLLDVPVTGAERQRGFVFGDGVRISLLRDRDVPKVQVCVQRIREDLHSLVKMPDTFRFLADLPQRQAQVIVK